MSHHRKRCDHCNKKSRYLKYEMCLECNEQRERIMRLTNFLMFGGKGSAYMVTKLIDETYLRGHAMTLQSKTKTPFKNVSSILV